MAKTVYINTTNSDVGRQTHPWTVWTDTQITLDSISKQGLSGHTFYFKVHNDGQESQWYGPVLIGEVYNELISLLSTPTLVMVGNKQGVIVNAILNISKQLNIPSITGQIFTGAVTYNALFSLSKQLQTDIDHTTLINALISISQNVILDVESHAVLNALISLLQSNSITAENFGNLLQAALEINSVQAINTSYYEPPAVYKVKFIRLKVQ